MSNIDKCEGCDLYKDGHCTKYRRNGRAHPSTKDWLDEPKYFIPVERMCRNQSPFGNVFIGLTQEDIDRLKNGEVIYNGGEYGTFIGFLS